MSRRERSYMAFSLLILLMLTYLYIVNFDIYQAVGTYSPVSGYMKLVANLGNWDWVTENCERWAVSSSPVLQSLYVYLTEDSAEFPSTILVGTLGAFAFGSVWSLAIIPVTMVKIRKRKEAFIREYRARIQRPVRRTE